MIFGRSLVFINLVLIQQSIKAFFLLQSLVGTHLEKCAFKFFTFCEITFSEISFGNRHLHNRKMVGLMRSHVEEQAESLILEKRFRPNPTGTEERKKIINLGN